MEHFCGGLFGMVELNGVYTLMLVHSIDSSCSKVGVALVFLFFVFFLFLKCFLKNFPVPHSVTVVGSSRIFRWQNLLVSFLHAAITGCSTLLCVWFYWNDGLGEDLMLFSNWPTYCVCCFATAYFIYDISDIVWHGKIREKAEVLLHHFAILFATMYVVTAVHAVGYCIVAMMVEVNTAFLHARKLMQMGGFSREQLWVRINIVCNLATFCTFRFVPLTMLTLAIFTEKNRLPSWFWIHYSISIAVLNVINVILFYRLIRTDVLSVGRYKQKSSNKDELWWKAHRKMDSGCDRMEMSRRIVGQEVVGSDSELENFVTVVQIWWKKPHLVHRRIKGVDTVENPYIPEQTMATFTRCGATADGEDRFICVPSSDDNEHCFYSRPYGVEMNTDKNDGVKILQAFVFETSESEGGAADDDDQKLLEIFSCKLLKAMHRWISHKKGSLKLSNTLSLVNQERFWAHYRKLKATYARSLINTIWEEERIEKGTTEMQSFVDLGCGNGLLVYLLNSEGHSGFGVDQRKRNIWDKFSSVSQLKQMRIDLTGNLDWLGKPNWIISNHADQLTPWIPIWATKLNDCNTFIIPCCPYDLFGKYQRQHNGQSHYRSYLLYIKEIMNSLDFNVDQDLLRIPSTKRICFVGRREKPCESVQLKVEAVLSQPCGRPLHVSSIEKLADNSDKKSNTGENDPSRNCNHLPRSFTDELVYRIAAYLLQTKRLKRIRLDKHRVLTWNLGGEAKISDCLLLLDAEEKLMMKNMFGGFKTLLKNNHQTFQIQAGKVRLRDWSTVEIKHKEMKKTKPCWFDSTHPNGCPLTSDKCPFLHTYIF
ncbi:putative tRNA (uracil-O(2)-)-methyltransferase [Trichinella pseudospiralis]|uniref:Probable tRNA (uracil-O(2)-)-methyltransferase n=2 Tax=Trichinella pseudospiralis TaxID=6337 RepID=A0A0V1G5G8_TRIPS|nr:putative tRNA (uracil-O(2)-)-methyltransferase [Trichinella pseudospiralis]